MRADRLHVARRDDGTLVVTGPLVVSSCACDPPPVSIAATRVEVAPDGDVRARDVSLRLMGITVLWAPWLALRAPSQVGLLPPTLAWRAVDGPFAGAGVHVPLGGVRSLDVHAGGYLRGTGADTIATLETERLRLRARWETLHGDRVAVAGRAAFGGDEPVNATVDVLRGPGVARSAIDLDTATRPRDRVDVAVNGASTLGASMFTYARRGQGERWSGLRVVAPFTASTRWGSVGVAADTISLSQGARSVSVARLEGSGSATAFAGPFRVDARVTSGAWVTSDASGAGASGAAATATLGVDLPLARRFGDAVHVVDPGLTASMLVVDERGAGLSLAPSPLARGTAGIASLPLTSLLGPPGRGWASATIEPGMLWREGDGVALGRTRIAASARYVRLRGDAAFVGRRTVVVATSQLGPRALHAIVAVESLDGVNPIEAQALGFGPATRNAWLTGESATGRTGLGIHHGALYAEAARVWSYSTGHGLAEEARLGWRPRCGCVDVTALGAHRVGREGIDVMLTAALFR